MSSPEKLAVEAFDYEAYENIRQKLQIPGHDRKTVQRELAEFCSQRIGQMPSMNGIAKVYRHRLSGEILPYEEGSSELNDETVTIVDATEFGLIVSRRHDPDRQPALEWYMADTFPIAGEAA